MPGEKSIVEEIEQDIDTDQSLLFGAGDDAGDDAAKKDETKADEGSTDEPKGDAGEEKKNDEPAKKDDVDDLEKDRDKWVPRGRFDEVYKKWKDAEGELEKVKTPAAKKDDEPAAKPEEVDLNKLERDFYTAYDAGNDDEAFAIRAKINAEIQRRAEEKAEERAVKKVVELDQKRNAEKEQAEIVKAADAVLQKYPALAENDQNNPLMDEVIEWRDFYRMKGHSTVKAIELAADKVMGGKTPEKKPDPPADKRKEDMVKRNADASQKQAPRLTDGVGDRSIPDSLTTAVAGKQEDWEKIPEAERKKMLE